MITITEMSTLHGIPRETAIKALKEKRLPGRKLGPIWVVDETDPLYEEFLAKYKPHKRREDNEDEAS